MINPVWRALRPQAWLVAQCTQFMRCILAWNIVSCSPCLGKHTLKLIGAHGALWRVVTLTPKFSAHLCSSSLTNGSTSKLDNNFMLNVNGIITTVEKSGVVSEWIFTAKTCHTCITCVMSCTIYGDTVEPACMVHGCKVNLLVWSIFGKSRTDWAFC